MFIASNVFSESLLERLLIPQSMNHSSPATGNFRRCPHGEKFSRNRLPLFLLTVFSSVFLSATSLAQSNSSPVALSVDFTQVQGPLEMDKMSLGQGGLSDDPIWEDRTPEIRALNPRLIRLFIQEYFDLLPEPNRYHFDTLDRSVKEIVAAGAEPMMCICFKPKTLFPRIDQDLVEPNDYLKWEDLIFHLVRHYQDLGIKIRYWEIGNEPDNGESGGCPYRFTPENFKPYYQHTAEAILRADPQAKVGGPALAGYNSPILPALLQFCSTNSTPINFISWHTYSSNPVGIAGTIEKVRTLVGQYPGLKPELIIDEWNMSLMKPSLDPRFQPCFVAETIWQMKAKGLDYSCYYHIRDWYVSYDQIATFMSPEGTAFMTRWWNRMPQFDGLFDYQNHVRPAYFTFKLLSRLCGSQLPVTSHDSSVHGFAARDEKLHMYNVMIWNFSAAPKDVLLSFQNIPAQMRVRHLRLDAASENDDEASRLKPDPFGEMPAGTQTLSVHLEPYAIHFWSFD